MIRHSGQFKRVGGEKHVFPSFHEAADAVQVYLSEVPEGIVGRRPKAIRAVNWLVLSVSMMTVGAGRFSTKERASVPRGVKMLAARCPTRSAVNGALIPWSGKPRRKNGSSENAKTRPTQLRRFGGCLVQSLSIPT